MVLLTVLSRVVDIVFTSSVGTGYIDQKEMLLEKNSLKFFKYVC